MLDREDALSVIGYALSLISMAFAGEQAYEVFTAFIPERSIFAVRVYQAFLFAFSFAGIAVAIHRKRRWSAKATLAISAGCFAMGFAFFWATLIWENALFAFLAATFLSIMRPLLVVFWIKRISFSERQDRFGFMIALSWCVSGFILVLTTHLGRRPTAYCAALALVIFGTLLYSFFVLRRDLRRSGVGETNSKKFFRWLSSGNEIIPSSTASYGAVVSQAWTFVLFASLLNMFSAVMRYLIVPTESVYGLDPGGLYAICKFLVAGAFLLAWSKLTETRALAKSLQVVYITLLFSTLLLYFFESFSIFVGILAGLASPAATILMTTACLRISTVKGVDAAIVYAAFAGMYFFLMATGNSFGVFAYHLAADNYSVHIQASVALVYALSVVFFLYSNAYARKQEARAVAEQAVLIEREVDKIASRCESLGTQFGLSPREQDVFELLAQGRNAAFVSAKLYISENTVRSHIKSIYSKMNIHSRQELFSLVNDDCGLRNAADSSS